MRFGTLKVPTRLLLAGCVTLGLQACVGAPRIVATPSACSTLIPDSWLVPVPGAPLPAGNVVGDWIAFGDQQTAQLDKANGRTADTLAIVSRCEERDRLAVKRARPKVLGVF